VVANHLSPLALREMVGTDKAEVRQEQDAKDVTTDSQRQGCESIASIIDSKIESYNRANRLISTHDFGPDLHLAAGALARTSL
jgi:hypothetical protein